MIKALIRFSATNRFLVLLATAVCVGYGVYTLNHIPVDAIPDLSDTQVIVYSRWDRSPDIMEDQVTYPIVTALLGAPNVKVVRGFSDFGFSYVYVIFKDGTDIYWARSRVLEYLSKIQPLLPPGVRTELGPDATGVGWVFQYALVDDSGTQSLADLRTLPGLEPPLPPAVRARRRRGGVDRRLRAAVPGHGRSRTASGPTSSRSWTWRRRSARATTRWAAGCSSSRARSTWSAGRGYVRGIGGPREDRAQDRREGDAGAAPRRRPGRPGPGDPARRRRPRRPRRHGGRDRRHAPRRERPRGDPPRAASASTRSSPRSRRACAS